MVVLLSFQNFSITALKEDICKSGCFSLFDQPSSCPGTFVFNETGDKAIYGAVHNETRDWKVDFQPDAMWMEEIFYSSYHTLQITGQLFNHHNYPESV